MASSTELPTEERLASVGIDAGGETRGAADDHVQRRGGFHEWVLKGIELHRGLETKIRGLEARLGVCADAAMASSTELPTEERLASVGIDAGGETGGAADDHVQRRCGVYEWVLEGMELHRGLEARVRELEARICELEARLGKVWLDAAKRRGLRREDLDKLNAIFTMIVTQGGRGE